MVSKTDSGYRTISVRLPRQEFIDFDKICNETHSSKLRELISKEIKNVSKSNFISGINRISYNKLNNSFNWIIQLDSGQEIEILNNLSDSFLKNLKKEMDEALQERNEWVHQTKSDSIEIPKELVEGEK